MLLREKKCQCLSSSAQKKELKLSAMASIVLFVIDLSQDVHSGKIEI